MGVRSLLFWVLKNYMRADQIIFYLVRFLCAIRFCNKVLPCFSLLGVVGTLRKIGFSWVALEGNVMRSVDDAGFL